MLCSLSLGEITALINSFEQNPFYTFLYGLLQAKADEAVKEALGGFRGTDLTAVLAREQVIGAALIYLEMANTIERLKQQIAEYNQTLQQP